MGSEGTIGRLGDYLERVIDNRGKTPPNDTKRTSFELLEVNCLTGSGRRPNYEVVRKFVTKEAYDSWFRNGHPKTNDVIISTVGSIGEVCISEGRGSIAQNLIALSPKPDALTGEFLYYYLCSPEVKNELLTLNISSVQPSIKVPHLLDLEISLLPLPEQKAIAHILGSLDDKIELNRRMNATLEGMAQALFKSWFVDFEPVIDNALAAGNPIPEELAPRAEVRRQALANGTANRDAAKAFPDSFQETEELSWIPEGWEVRELRAITSKISKGTTPRKSETTEALDPEIIPFLKVRDITDNGDLKDSDFDLIPRSIHEKSLKRSILTTGDVLFSIAGTIGRVTIVPSELNDSNINQAIAFIRPDGSINSMFILEHLRGSYVQDRIHSRVVQAVQANISLTEIGDIPVPIPSAKIHDAWLTNTTEIYQKIATLKLLNRSLTKLRDTLLPKLISGELRISEAEQLTGEALA